MRSKNEMLLRKKEKKKITTKRKKGKAEGAFFAYKGSSPLHPMTQIGKRGKKKGARDTQLKRKKKGVARSFGKNLEEGRGSSG